ncbi:MAG TPA: nucleotidyltransferase domain-containing protein [Kribbellaceae bacterium]|nr:nucleotidyltransferase domain-containing protein [Kribbellaceae bacterium]
MITTLDGPVLAALARTTEPLSGSRVQRLAGAGSETGVRKVLRRLAATGLVTVSEAGASRMYALNRNHLAAAAVLQLTSLRQLLVDRIRALIATWDPRPIHASLFGSTARGDGDLDSDVDILLIHEDFADPPSSWSDQVSDLAERVHEWTGNHAQMYEFSASQLGEHLVAGEPIVQDWIRDGITLAGVDFRHLRTAHRSPR